MIVHILISIFFLLVLMFLSVNLIGLLIRGLFSNPELDRLKQDEKTHEFIKLEIGRIERADTWINIIALILLATYMYFLFHFWNIGVVAVAAILMCTRLPDLLWEIRHGRKIDIKSAPRTTLSHAMVVIDWLMLPALYYSLYYL